MTEKAEKNGTLPSLSEHQMKEEKCPAPKEEEHCSRSLCPSEEKVQAHIGCVDCGVQGTDLAQALCPHLALVVVKKLGLVGRLVLPQLCRLAIERTLDIRVAKHTLDGEQHGANVVGRRPLLLEDIEADVAILVDVGVVAGRLEFDSGRSVRVVLGKRQRQLERQALVDLVVEGERWVSGKAEVKG